MSLWYFHCQYVLLFLQRFHCMMYTVLLYISRVDHAYHIMYIMDVSRSHPVLHLLYYTFISHMVYCNDHGIRVIPYLLVKLYVYHAHTEYKPLQNYLLSLFVLM